jgi:hypothetical protein
MGRGSTFAPTLHSVSSVPSVRERHAKGAASPGYGPNDNHRAHVFGLNACVLPFAAATASRARWPPGNYKGMARRVIAAPGSVGASPSRSEQA